MQLKTTLFSLLFLVLGFTSKASDTLQINQEMTDLEMQIAYQLYADSISKSLSYQHGKVFLRDDIASVVVPNGFKYLNGEDSDMVLTDLWGNPPRTGAYKSLGMLFPENDSPLSDSTYAINITYSEDGYIDDEDAKSLDYDDLLTSMREEMSESNPMRIEQGYEPIHLVGWASPPYYDAANKKLHWAKELKFSDYPMNTLNYSIRVLGRRGYLEMNVIGEMIIFDEVKKNIPAILESVNFNDGNKYSDFNPDIDQVAAYGIGGLIAGKMLLKAGILAKVGFFFAKFWKIIALAVVGFFSGIKKFFGKKEEDETVS